MTRALASLALACLPLLAPAQVRSAIQAQYDRFAKAYVANDVEAMLKILAPEYTLKNAEGEVKTRREYERTLRGRAARGRTTQLYKVRIVSLEVRGDRAEVRSHEVSSGKDGKEHVHVYQDTWRRVKGVWRLAATRSLGHGS